MSADFEFCSAGDLFASARVMAIRQWRGMNAGLWEVSVFVPSACFGSKYRWLSCPCVVDDFGDLVAIGDRDGKVVFQ